MNNHRYALDAHGQWADATKTEYRKHILFFCDCPERHRMRLVKPSGDLGKRPFCDYFAHNVKRMKVSHHRDDAEPSCASGGESELHRRAKHVLREMVGRYRFATFRCWQCLEHEECEDTEGCSVTIEVRSGDGRWRYDCLLKRGDVPVAALEVVHTHRTGEEKATAVRASGLEIVEFSAQDVLDMVGKQGVVQLENLQVRFGRCQACLLHMSIQWIRVCYSDENNELALQEAAQFSNYMRADELRRRGERAETLGRILREVGDVVKRCKLLLALGLQSGVLLRIREVGTVTCSGTEEWEHGLLGYGFNTPLPTRQVCIVILQDGVDVRSLGLRWNYRGIARRFYFFINRATILQRLNTVRAEGAKLCLMDCRPEKQFQRHVGGVSARRRTVGTCDSWYGGVFATLW